LPHPRTGDAQHPLRRDADAALRRRRSPRIPGHVLQQWRTRGGGASSFTGVLAGPQTRLCCRPPAAVSGEIAAVMFHVERCPRLAKSRMLIPGRQRRVRDMVCTGPAVPRIMWVYGSCPGEGVLAVWRWEAPGRIRSGGSTWNTRAFGRGPSCPDTPGPEALLAPCARHRRWRERTWAP
jgi:hypothetical protein